MSALAQSEEPFRLLVEGVTDYAIFMLDPAGYVVSWNAGAERIKGYHPHEIVGQHFSRFYPDEDVRGGKPEHGLHIAAAEGRFEGEGWRVRKDGSLFWANVVITALRDEAGQLRGFAKVTRDLTERRRAEEALRASEERFRVTFNQAAVGIGHAAPEGRWLLVNRRLCDIVGYSRHELLARTLQDITYPEDLEADLALVRRVFAGELQTYSIEKRYTHRDGSVVWVNQTVSLVRDAAGAPNYLITVVEDIRERKRAEAERAELLVRERAARTEAEAAIHARDEFLSAAAHELKTPITSLRGFSQTNLRRLDKTGTLDLARVRRAFETIDRQSEKLERLVEQLLDVSRIESGRLVLHPQVTDLVHLVEAVVAAARARTTRHTIAIHASDSLLMSLDPLRIEQVLVNLLDNAAKFSPNGGPIDIEIGKGEAATVHLSVTDRGIGISPDQRQRIFDRFYQAATPTYLGGLGLGLFISRQIVELHGGRLEVEAPVEGGTRFVISLPASLARALDAREAEQG